MSNMSLTDASAWAPQPGKTLGTNPQLSEANAGQYGDSMYQAQLAQLRKNVLTNYGDILQQIGFSNPATGAFVPGTVSIDAARQAAEYQHGMGEAQKDVVKQHQLQGTLFSGLLPEDTAKAEYPFVQGIADLGVQVPRTLSSLYEKGSGLLQDWTIQNNLLLADAAQRYAQNLLMQGGGYGGGGGGGLGGPVGSPGSRYPVGQNPDGSYYISMGLNGVQETFHFNPNDPGSWAMYPPEVQSAITEAISGGYATGAPAPTPPPTMQAPATQAPTSPVVAPQNAGLAPTNIATPDYVPGAPRLW